MKRDIQSYRTRLQNPNRAEKYATRFERGSRRQVDQREQRAVEKIFSQLSDCRSVLDVPSGAGRFLATLSQGERAVIQMDVASDILQWGKERAETLNLTASFVLGDASRVPLADGSVDAIFCNRLLHHITSSPERTVFLREFRRITCRFLIISFFDYLAFGGLRQFLKAIKGRKVDYTGQPTQGQFLSELAQCGFKLRQIVPTGPVWVSEKYLLLEIA